MAEYLRVVKLKEYQHYKDRNPSWVKLHSQILTSRTWVTLDDHSRVLMVVCMVIAASTGNKIPLDPAYIRRAAYLDHDPDFTALIDAGFVEVIDEAGNPVRNASKAYGTLAPRTECLQSVSTARPEERRAEESRADKKHLRYRFGAGRFQRHRPSTCTHPAIHSGKAPAEIPRQGSMGRLRGQSPGPPVIRQSQLDVGAVAGDGGEPVRQRRRYQQPAAKMACQLG